MSIETQTPIDPSIIDRNPGPRTQIDYRDSGFGAEVVPGAEVSGLPDRRDFRDASEYGDYIDTAHNGKPTVKTVKQLDRIAKRTERLYGGKEGVEAKHQGDIGQTYEETTDVSHTERDLLGREKSKMSIHSEGHMKTTAIGGAILNPSEGRRVEITKTGRKGKTERQLVVEEDGRAVLKGPDVPYGSVGISDKQARHEAAKAMWAMRRRIQSADRKKNL